MFASKGKREDQINHFSQIVIELEQFLTKNRKKGHPWILGFDQPTMTDLFLFPFLERIVLMKGSSWEDTYYALDVEDHATNMVDYVKKFREIKEFEDVLMKPKAYAKYLDKLRTTEEGRRVVFTLDLLDEE